MAPSHGAAFRDVEPEDCPTGSALWPDQRARLISLARRALKSDGVGGCGSRGRSRREAEVMTIVRRVARGSKSS